MFYNLNEGVLCIMDFIVFDLTLVGCGAYKIVHCAHSSREKPVFQVDIGKSIYFHSVEKICMNFGEHKSMHTMLVSHAYLTVDTTESTSQKRKILILQNEMAES